MDGDWPWELLAAKYIISVIIGLVGITIFSAIYFSKHEKRPEDLICYLLYMGIFGVLVFNATAW